MTLVPISAARAARAGITDAKETTRPNEATPQPDYGPAGDYAPAGDYGPAARSRPGRSKAGPPGGGPRGHGGGQPPIRGGMGGGAPRLTGHPDSHRVAVAVVPLEIGDCDGRDGGAAHDLALRGDLDRLADAGQGDGPLAEHAARPDDQVLQARAVELVGLLEAVDERAALDGDAAAHRVHPPVRVGPARRHVQVQGHHVACCPGPLNEVVAR